MKELIILKAWKYRRYGFAGFAPLVIFIGVPTDKLRKHESKHVEQILAYAAKHGAVLGRIFFFAKYFYYLIRYGYKTNPFEVEADQL